jgi:hypothetical protein
MKYTPENRDIKHIVFLMFFIIWCNNNLLYSQYHGKQGSSSLQGLTNIAIEIANLDSVTESDGLKKFPIENDIILKLNRSGLKLLTENAWQDEPGHPLLFLNINAIKYEELQFYVFSITLDFNQDVSLLREPSLNVGARTWGASLLGTAEENNLVNEIHISVNELIDLFIEDFLTINSY